MFDGNFIPRFLDHAREGVKLFSEATANNDPDGTKTALAICVTAERTAERAAETRTLGTIIAALNTEARRVVSPIIASRLQEILSETQLTLTMNDDCIGSKYVQAQRLEADCARFRDALAKAHSIANANTNPPTQDRF
jgi:hypothetical protein